MCRDIMELSNALIYGDRLRCGSEETANTKLEFSSLKLSSSWLKEVIFFLETLCNGRSTSSKGIYVQWLKDPFQEDSKDGLHTVLEKLRDEQRCMENDLSNIQIRWHTLREEKAKAANTWRDVRKAEEELDRLTEGKGQVDFDEKHLAEALVPLSKEKDKLLNDHNELKDQLNREYEELGEKKRNFQQEVETLLRTTSKIKAYLDLKKDERLKELQEKKGKEGTGRISTSKL